MKKDIHLIDSRDLLLFERDLGLVIALIAQIIQDDVGIVAEDLIGDRCSGRQNVQLEEKFLFGDAVVVALDRLDVDQHFVEDRLSLYAKLKVNEVAPQSGRDFDRNDRPVVVYLEDVVVYADGRILFSSHVRDEGHNVVLDAVAIWRIDHDLDLADRPAFELRRLCLGSTAKDARAKDRRGQYAR